jgi:ubiquitin carboxyl-terminal hydrolase 7
MSHLISCRSITHLAAAALLTVSSSNLTLAANAASKVIISNGLRNLGNTCYMNAQLQCHFHIPRVRQLIKEGLQQDNGEQQQQQQQQEETIGLQSLRHVLNEMELAATTKGVGIQSSTASPAMICRAMGISTMEQQDSQEFWKLFLPAMKLPPLIDLYQGAFEDYIVSLDGNHEKRREEPFLDLSLEITMGSVPRSLSKLFGEPELLSEKEGNAWRPEKGMPKVDALKGSLLRVQGLPSLLSLHLKRFQYDWQTDQTSKSHAQFQFDDVLDLSSICTDIGKNEEESAMYELQSIVVHTGEFGGGHYYAYVRPDIRSNDWYRFNDQQVDAVCFDDVVMDAFGGRTSKPKKNRGILGRLFGGSGGYGWGGRAASAYMLQYVRRSEIEHLYGLDSDY